MRWRDQLLVQPEVAAEIGRLRRSGKEPGGSGLHRHPGQAVRADLPAELVGLDQGQPRPNARARVAEEGGGDAVMPAPNGHPWTLAHGRTGADGVQGGPQTVEGRKTQPARDLRL